MRTKHFDASTIVALALIAAALAPAALAQPEAGFDCARATSRVENLICADEELATLDRSMAAYYAAAQQTFAESRDCLRTDQVRWLRQVRNRCEDAGCLERAYLDRLAELDAVQPGAAAITYRELPARPALIAIVPQNGDAELTPQEPARDVSFIGRYAFDENYGLTFVDEQERRYVLTALNQSVPESLPALEKQKTKLVVRGKVLQRPPAKDAYPDMTPPHGEFDPHACVFLHRAE